jgi:aspartyl-tRNA(Asn)/glutamyl-tRNA(Gln) amidotransferase subunit B
MEYEAIICFETHVELKTRSKLFCSCPVRYDAEPNTNVCPVCTGQPGALPVLNRRALEFTIRAGLAMGCTINRKARFARKNYFYPDLPKGYQISQYESPVCEDGYLIITGDDGEPYPVGIKRIHLEEDAGKLVHSSDAFSEADFSLVDYNRSSVPLLEIVTDHERNPLRSIQEARQYLEKLRQTLIYIDISDCIIEKGQFRCDVNISLRPKGSKEFGNRSEIKNMASFRYIMDALEYEIKRQKNLLESGKKPLQETRLFDEQKKITQPMRSKEDAPDYRYFPDPDLVEVEITEEMIESVEKGLPELPDQKLKKITEDYGIPMADALIITKDPRVSEFFEKAVKKSTDPVRLSRWFVNELFRFLKESSLSIMEIPATPEQFASLVNMVSKGQLTDTIARDVLEKMFKTGEAPEKIVEKEGLKPIEDEKILLSIIEEVIESNPETIDKIRKGDPNPVNYLVGQVMRKTRGKANPKKVRQMIEKKLL